MIRLPFTSAIDNEEIRSNFEEVETSVSPLKFADQTVASGVGGSSTKKLAVEDSQGKIIGFIPIYPE